MTNADTDNARTTGDATGAPDTRPAEASAPTTDAGRPHRARHVGRVIKRTCAVILLLALGALLAFVLARANALQALGIKGDALPSVGDTETTLTSDTVREVVAPASDLITTRYYYTNAETYRSSKTVGDASLPGTEDVVVYTYDGTVSLGIDLSQASYEVDDATKTITVRLPDVQIMANEIDQSSFEPQYESYSVLNPMTLQDAYKSEADLKQEAAEKVMANDELLATTAQNARNVIRDFLTSASATSGYAVRFAGDDADDGTASAASSSSDGTSDAHATND